MSMRFNKTTGPKPTKKLLDQASQLARSGTSSHIAVAMAMRPAGATQAEIINALGHPHRNKLKQLINEGLVKKHVIPDGSRSVRIKLIKKH